MLFLAFLVIILAFIAGTSGGGWGGQTQTPSSGNFGNSYQQGYSGGAVRNTYQQQRPAPYSKFGNFFKGSKVQILVLFQTQVVMGAAATTSKAQGAVGADIKPPP